MDVSPKQARVMRAEFAALLSKLPPNVARAEVQQLIVDMMDYTEQSDDETFYVTLYDTAVKFTR